MKRRNQDGAIVVEATLSLSFFMFFITAILTMVNVCYTQAQMGMFVNGIAKDISNYTYIYTMTDANAKKAELSSKASYANYTASEVMDGSKKVMDKVQDLADAVVDPEFWESVLALAFDTGVSHAESWAVNQICLHAAENRLKSNNEDPDAYLRRLGVEDGLDGLDFFKSELCPEGSDDIKIVVSYKAHMVDFFGLDLNFNLEQTAMTKAWCAIKPSVYRNTDDGSGTGDSSAPEGGDEEDDGDKEHDEHREDEDTDPDKAPAEEESVEDIIKLTKQELARKYTKNGSSDSVCLGRMVDDYRGEAEKFGQTYYDMDEEVYNRLVQERGLDFAWEVNEEFLHNQEIAGKTFYLCTSPYNVATKSTYYMEVEWLESRGYTFEYDPGVGLWKAVRK